jgi:prolyl-tRNA synthetase
MADGEQKKQGGGDKQKQQQKQGGGGAPKVETAITPTRAQDYAEWYQQVVKASDLAENSVVRGCMVIKPWGYAIWERFQAELDAMFKATGHKNAYFPLFIPKSFLEKEAEHVDGFAKECAVVTHHRLIPGPDGGLIPDPNSKLEEPLIVRPTSETIIGASFAQWVQSYRDLPLLINQWANVVRWEMRTRLFLRTAEFLWQEGHTAHATPEEAQEETRQMLDVYTTFAEEFMAMPVFKGKKTESEKFPGAVDTFSIEAMMQDKRALQAGTSHFLGQNFAKASGIKFQSKHETEEHAWTTSWGVSTRLVGGMVMTHGDDNGIIVPPRLAPQHAVVLPVFRDDEGKAKVMEAIAGMKAELSMATYAGRRIELEVDARDIRGGEKSWDWIKRGIPLRIEIGPRDIESGTVMVARRDRGTKDKESIPRADLPSRLPVILAEIQQGLFDRAKAFRDANTQLIENKADFEAYFAEGGPQGFAVVHWAGDAAIEKELREKFKVTVRNVPQNLESAKGEGTCIFTGKPSPQRVIFAKAY